MAHFGRSSFSGRSRTLGWILVLVGATANACDDRRHAPSPLSALGTGGVSPVMSGPEDRPSNGLVRVDEAGLHGAFEGTRLELEIPVEALEGAPARGSLEVKLLSVDGVKELATARVPYDLAAGARATLRAELEGPEATEQVKLVDYVVRVTSTGATETDGVSVTKSLLHVIPLYELEVRGPKLLRAEKDAVYRVRAEHPITRAPVSEVEVTLTLEQNGQQITRSVSTDERGDASVSLDGLAVGSATLKGEARAFGASAEVTDTLTVEANRPKLLLTTDKPLYQPGQTIHLRVLGLEREGNKPLAKTSLTFEVQDAKGNKVFKKVRETDAFGVAATSFTIGQVVNEGTYKLRVTQDGTTTEKTVEVTRYALPKFALAIATEKPWYRPGEMLTGAVDARYFFGKTVAGEIKLEAFTLDVGQTPFQSIVGRLDETGHYTFSLQLPSGLVGQSIAGGNALVTVRATVTDAAGQKVQKEIALPVSPAAAKLSLVPEASELVPGIENELLFFVTDPLGAPLSGVDFSVKAADGQVLEGKTDDFGQAALTWDAPEADAASAWGVFQASARVGEEDVVQPFQLGRQGGSEHLLVRTDKAVYEQGEEVKVEVLTSNPSAKVYVDWLNDGQTADVRSLELEDGRATFKMPIDTALLGDNRVEAYVVEPGGNLVRAWRTVFARSNRALQVDLETDKSVYGPGEPAKLTFKVRDEDGKPAVAALGVQIVDEAVYGLVDSKPGLLRSYFELNDAFAKPSYQIRPPATDFNRMFFVDTASSDADSRAAAQRTTQGALAALGSRPLMGVSAASYPALERALPARLSAPYQALGKGLEKSLQEAVDASVAALKAEGCPDSRGYQCGSQSFQARLQGEVAKRFQAFDFWGQPLRLRQVLLYGSASLATNGPDELEGTGDDGSFSVPFKSLMSSPPVGVPGAAGASGVSGPAFAPAPAQAANPEDANSIATGSGTPPAPAGGATEPRVRDNFPETLYVNPAVITDASGNASIDLTLADSITAWRVSSLASSADGRLGGGEAGLTVFQDFFVDVAFPAELTRGDQVTFPIAVYNYLDEAQDVSLELEAASWYTPLGSSSLTVHLEAGEVKGVGIPVRVEEVGFRGLKVIATGRTRADAVLRQVRVVPDGKRATRAQSGLLASGATHVTATFPDNAVKGSGELYVDLYPGAMSEVVSGMDSILRTPTGCFEQTTSSAWPNVLVTEYMQQTQQITPEIELKAESLMSAGYQRLLTFEHPGGGFSWFGTQDPKPYLSVTAFGLMEFSDMARVHDIDEAMLQRTRAWLAAQQKADGSFAGDMSEFFSFHTSTLRNTAFVVWALASGGYMGDAVTRGLDFVKDGLDGQQDAYTLGIVANAFALADPTSSVLGEVLDELDSKKRTDGDKIYWDSAGTQTNFYGAGNDAAVSATALVLHALLTVGGHTELVEGALAYLASQKDANGNFGSTQATIWALRALTLAAKNGSEPAIGELEVFVDDELFSTLELEESGSDVMTRVDLSSLASAGEHDVRLAFQGSGAVRYNVVASHNVPWTAAPVEPAGPLNIAVSYDKSTLYVNETVTASIRVENTTKASVNMVLVTLGLPPGFEVVPTALEASLQNRSLSRYEVTGRQLILYVTELPPGTPKTFTYQLRATLPVEATDGGARAELYYEPEKRASAGAQALVVSAL